MLKVLSGKRVWSSQLKVTSYMEKIKYMFKEKIVKRIYFSQS